MCMFLGFRGNYVCFSFFFFNSKYICRIYICCKNWFPNLHIYIILTYIIFLSTEIYTKSCYFSHHFTLHFVGLFFVSVNYFICLMPFKWACKGTSFLCLFHLFSFSFSFLFFCHEHTDFCCKKRVCFWWIVTRIGQIILTHIIFWSTEIHTSSSNPEKISHSVVLPCRINTFLMRDLQLKKLQPMKEGKKKRKTEVLWVLKWGLAPAKHLYSTWSDDLFTTTIYHINNSMEYSDELCTMCIFPLYIYYTWVQYMTSPLCAFQEYYMC